jgi:hypothetical protein
VTENITMGVTMILENSTDGDGDPAQGDLHAKSWALQLLASPRYYYPVTDEGTVALYAGPDLGLVFFGVDDTATGSGTTDYTGDAIGLGYTFGSKFYIGDSFSLFTELYSLFYERSDSDGFEEDIEFSGLRIGFSVFF